MRMIKFVVFTCPNCGTVAKIPLNAANEKLKSFEGDYEYKCEICSYNFSKKYSPGESEANPFSRVVDLCNVHNSSVIALELLRTAGLIDYE